MTRVIKQVLIGLSACVGIGTIANPAFAGSLTNAAMSGTASYLTYDANQTNTYKVNNTPANLVKVLSGDLSSPTGNVELFSNSEMLSNDAFKSYTGVSTLTGTIGGREITLSSLTTTDWASAVGTKTLGRAWFDETMSKNGLDALVGTDNGTKIFDIFTQYGGMQRFSDPNVAYVNQDDTTGMIKIGLAGHLDATPLFLKSVDAFLASNASKQSKALVSALRPVLAAKKLQASELIKYTYNNQMGYLYSHSAVSSNLVEEVDKISHSGIYEAFLQGIAPEKPKPKQEVPEPSMLLGLVSLGGFLATKRKQSQNA